MVKEVSDLVLMLEASLGESDEKWQKIRAAKQEKERNKYLHKYVYVSGRKKIKKARGLGISNRWRLKVFIRDEFRCQKCGWSSLTTKGLCAHHINNYHDFPLERLEVNNGMTLCSPCHRQFHKLYKRRCKKIDNILFLENRMYESYFILSEIAKVLRFKSLYERIREGYPELF